MAREEEIGAAPPEQNLAAMPCATDAVNASSPQASEPVEMVSKRVKWTRRVGQISRGLPGIPPGSKYYRAYQKSAGSNKHSGPSGKRASRFYQGRRKG